MANSNDKNRLNYGASNYKPDSGRGSVSFGRVGDSVRDLSGRSYGSGVGATVSIPMKSKSKAKGGAIKKSGCEVKAYGDMIKKAAGGKVQTSSDTARKLATEMGGMKKGGVQKKAVGGPLPKVQGMTPQMPVAKPTQSAGKVMGAAEIAAERRKQAVRSGERLSPDEVQRRAKALIGPVVDDPRVAQGAGARVARVKPPSAKTIADTLRGKAKPVVQATDPRRPMPKPKPPVVVKPSVLPVARPTVAPKPPLVKVPAGYQPGKNGQPTLAEEIRSLKGMTPGGPAYNQQKAWIEALSKPTVAKPVVKPPVAKPTPMPINERPNPADPREIIVTATKPAPPPTPIQYKNGGKTSKFAKGGAGKVRKGMMSPEGSILKAVKPKKGIGGM